MWLRILGIWFESLMEILRRTTNLFDLDDFMSYRSSIYMISTDVFYVRQIENK